VRTGDGRAGLPIREYGSTVPGMKTTVDIEDGLAFEVRKLAAEERRTLKDLVEEGLRRVLRDPGGAGLREPRIRWVTAQGGVPEETADRDRMARWMERRS